MGLHDPHAQGVRRLRQGQLARHDCLAVEHTRRMEAAFKTEIPALRQALGKGRA